MDKADLPRFYSAKEISEALGVSKTAVQNWDREGILNPIRIGKRLKRYKAEEVEALLNQ